MVFYSYGEPPKKLPLTRPYEFADIKQLWKSLDANQPQYNCGRKYPSTFYLILIDNFQNYRKRRACV